MTPIESVENETHERVKTTIHRLLKSNIHTIYKTKERNQRRLYLNTNVKKTMKELNEYNDLAMRLLTALEFDSHEVFKIKLQNR